MYRLVIRIRPEYTICPNTNTLFKALFGTEANMKRIFGTSLGHIESSVGLGAVPKCGPLTEQICKQLTS